MGQHVGLVNGGVRRTEISKGCRFDEQTNRLVPVCEQPGADVALLLLKSKNQLVQFRHVILADQILEKKEIVDAGPRLLRLLVSTYHLKSGDAVEAGGVV